MHYQVFFFLIFQNQYLYGISRLFRLSPFHAFENVIIDFVLAILPCACFSDWPWQQGKAIWCPSIWMVWLSFRVLFPIDTPVV